MEVIIPKLLVWGPLGLYAIAATYAVVFLYQAKERDRRAYEEKIEILTDRARTNAESWATKGFELGERLARGVERARHRRRGGEEERDE